MLSLDGFVRGIPVAKLRAILDAPENRIHDDDIVVINQVGNLHFLTPDFKDARMWIDLMDEEFQSDAGFKEAEGE